MAGKKSPGVAPIGHGPFGKEKLEGPKMKHDDHGIDASRPMKGSGPAVPNKFWEVRYDLNKPSHYMRVTEGDAFEPHQASKTPTTYLKVNKEDH